MKSILQILAILPLLATSVLATGDPSLQCRTVLGSKTPKSVPTVTVTYTKGRQPTVKIRPTVTSYVAVKDIVTRFTTKTKTFTDTTETDIFTTTTTQYSVETSVITSTLTNTETKTDVVPSTSTTIVPTTAGFRNIRDTLNSYNYKRGLSNPHLARAPGDQPDGALALTIPVRVDCTTTVPNTNTQTVYTTMPAVTDTIAYLKRTTKVRTIVSTSTIVPADVSVTLTDTFTSQVTTSTTTIQTDTQTITTTSTSIIPGPTLFDACSNMNTFGPDFTHSGSRYHVINVANNGPGVASDFKAVANGASTATECCNECQRLATCETFIFRARNRNCFLLYHEGATCPSQSNHPNYFLSKAGANTGAGYVVGNGNCGFAYSGNSDGSVYSVDM